MRHIAVIFSMVIFGFISAEIKSQTSFPEIENWKKIDPVNYNADNLWEYINGAADYYLGYGFTKLELVEYQRTADEYIKLEIYQHDSPLNTFGIYAYERFQDVNFIKTGAEGYMNHSALNFYTGTWYVKIYSHQSDQQTIDAIKLLAEKLLGINNCGSEIPNELKLLPVENKIEHSEKFTPENYLGFSFMTRVIAAEYKLNNSKYTHFVSIKADTVQALASLQKYLDFTKTNAKAEQERIFEVEDMFNGKMFLKVSGNHLMGISGLLDLKVAEQIL